MLLFVVFLLQLDSVVCTGSESSLHDCSHDPWGENNCGNHEQVGVICAALVLTGENNIIYKNKNKNKFISEQNEMRQQ